MNRIKTIILTLAFATGLLAAAPIAAASALPNYTVVASFQSDAQSGANTVGGGQGKSIPDIVSTIVNILSLIVGMAGVIMVVYSGMKYVTSGGDANKVGSAKNTLIYALVGLAVAAIAEFLVHFVLTQTSG
jgi:uncharacterized membrane protein YuzA (DUF378 family)